MAGADGGDYIYRNQPEPGAAALSLDLLLREGGSRGSALDLSTNSPGQQDCAPVNLPHVQIDGLPVWFQQHYSGFDTNKNGKLSDSEVDSALKTCLNGTDRAYLELLKRCKHSSIAQQYGLDKPNQEISPANMRDIDGWIKNYDREKRDFAKNDPTDAHALEYLRRNFARLDANNDGKISKGEVTAAALRNLQDAGLQQLRISFDAIAASTGGKPTAIGSKEIAAYTLDKNIEASGFFGRVSAYFGHDLKVGVYTAIEELRRTQ